MTETERIALIDELAQLEEETGRRTLGNFRRFFPDAGAYRRELYPKQLEFFAAGATFKERLFMAANRVGKSEAGAYEVTCHLTGLYPTWWTGRRFSAPVDVWACGTNSQTTRDIVQAKFLGPVHAPSTAMIPAHLIVQTTAARGGLVGAIEGVRVRHMSGGESLLGFKTYEQGRQSFEGTAKHLIWCDEEPPLDCYTEMLFRTITTKGITLTTFTPLQGMSEVVKSFLEPETDDARRFKCVVQAGWKDVPHLDEAEKAAISATTPPYQLRARTEGDVHTPRSAVVTRGEQCRNRHQRSVATPGLGQAQGVRAPRELVARVSPLPSGRQGHRQDRQA